MTDQEWDSLKGDLVIIKNLLRAQNHLLQRIADSQDRALALVRAESVEDKARAFQEAVVMKALKGA